MKVKELKERLKELTTNFKDKLNKGEAENRTLSSEELTEVEGLKTEIQDLNKEIQLREYQNSMATPPAGTQQPTEQQKRKIWAIDEITGPNSEMQLPSGFMLTRSQVEEKNRHRRAGQAVEGGYDPGIAEVENVYGPLVPVTIFEDMGANILSGADEHRIPVANKLGTVPAFLGENDPAEKQEITFRDVLFQEHRLSIEIPISKRFARRDRVGATQYVVNRARARLKEAVESAILSNNARNVGVNPGGLLHNSISTQVDAASSQALDYSYILTQRGTMADSFVNAAAIKLLLPFSQENKLRGLTLDTGSGRFVLSGDQVSEIGMQVYASTLMAANSAIFLDPAHFFLKWFDGPGTSLLYDPFTLAGNNQDRYVINMELDYQLIHQAAAIAVINLT